MGRAMRWLRSFLGGKKEAKLPLSFSTDDTKEPKANESKKTASKERRRWSFGKSFKERSTAPIAAEAKTSYNENYASELENEQNKHAIAVAVATAAAADAAVAAAQAAAAVVQLTSNGFSLLSGGINHEEFAAVRIQTAFRGYLARRALCALKGLVKLQALVRGHIVRKQAAATLRCMQALVRVQARVRARRVRMSEEGQAVQMKLLQRRQREPCPRKSAEGWNASTGSVEELELKVQTRHAAAMKRQRALSYAFSQQGTANGQNSVVIDCDLDKQYWGSTWLDRWMAACPWESPDVDDLGGQDMEGSSLDESAKIVEMDTSRPKLSSKKWTGSMRESVFVEPSMSSNASTAQYPPYASRPQPACSPSCPERSVCSQLASHVTSQPARLSIPRPASEGPATLAFQDFSPASLYAECIGAEESVFSTAQSSPQFSSAVSKIGGKRGPFTPSKSEYAENFFHGYSAFPNYMANTESSRAKVRSQSAPKQRPDPSEKNVLSSKKRMSLQGAMENRSSLSGVRMQRSSSQVRATSKGYQYISPIRLDRSTTSLRDSEFDTASIINGDY